MATFEAAQAHHDRQRELIDTSTPPNHDRPPLPVREPISQQRGGQRVAGHLDALTKLTRTVSSLRSEDFHPRAQGRKRLYKQLEDRFAKVHWEVWKNEVQRLHGIAARKLGIASTESVAKDPVALAHALESRADEHRHQRDSIVIEAGTSIRAFSDSSDGSDLLALLTELADAGYATQASQEAVVAAAGSIIEAQRALEPFTRPYPTANWEVLKSSLMNAIPQLKNARDGLAAIKNALPAKLRATLSAQLRARRTEGRAHIATLARRERPAARAALKQELEQRKNQIRTLGELRTRIVRERQALGKLIVPLRRAIALDRSLNAADRAMEAARELRAMPGTLLTELERQIAYIKNLKAAGTAKLGHVKLSDRNAIPRQQEYMVQLLEAVAQHWASAAHFFDAQPEERQAA